VTSSTTPLPPDPRNTSSQPKHAVGESRVTKTDAGLDLIEGLCPGQGSGTELENFGLRAKFGRAPTRHMNSGDYGGCNAESDRPITRVKRMQTSTEY
jgi:hypothetical protein